MNVHSIKNRHKRARIIWGFILAVFVFLEFYFFYLVFIRSVEDWDVYSGILSLNSYFIIFPILFFIMSLRVRCLYYKVNGREMCVSVGFIRDYLIYDNRIVDSTRSSGFQTPPMHFNENGLNIKVKLGSFGGVDVNVNNRVLRKGESINLDTIVSPVNIKNSLIEDLKELNNLKNSGVLSEEEYKTLKNKILK